MIRAVASLAAACACACAPAAAQTYPTKPIRIIVPATPGGGTDILARTLAQKLSERLGQQVIVDNRAGGSGMIGSEAVAKAAPDGHTLLVTYTAHIINPGLQPKMLYDTLNDFASISMIGVIPSVLVLHPSVPAKSVKALIALAKAKPGELNYASAGSGSASHLAGVLFGSMAGVNIVHVPYKGGAPSVADVIGGHVSLSFANLTPTLPHIRSGRLRALAVTSAKRTPAIPELPTLAESGLPGYEAVAVFALFAPDKTPAAIIGRLNSETVSILQMPEIKDRLASQGADTMPTTPAELDRYLRAEIPKWTQVIRASGAKAE